MYGSQRIFLPSVSEEMFTQDGLNIERFVEALKLSNQLQQEQLTVDIMKAAVEQFGLKRFPTAASGLVGQFLAQVSGIVVFRSPPSVCVCHA